MANAAKSGRRPVGLPKCPTGIQGLDEITLGGLPRGRPTLVCGAAGCGKTLLGMEFLVRGATQFGETGVCLSFEESAEELARNVADLGFDVGRLIARKKLVIDYVFVERSLIQETGEYDLEALFIRLGHAIDSIGAKRVLLDSVESLFAGLANEAILRAELRRLFRWLKERKVTAVVTGERGHSTLTRHGLEEYISDCVILLDHRVTDSVYTRRLRVVKYRGSIHGTNEFPFLIDESGISVLPVTSVELKHGASNERISSGVPALDAMLGGNGYYRGSSILVSGTAGTGKTSLAACFVDAACARGERCVYFSLEESQDQVIRNLGSIGLDLGRWIAKGLLQFHGTRPTMYGLETHLVRMHKVLSTFRPGVTVVDPITALLQSGSHVETRSMLLRLIDYLKEQQITALMTTLTGGGSAQEHTDVDVSSLVDTWLLLRDIESGGERNRGLYILKARGLAHSNQVREFLLTDGGLELREVYTGPGGVLTGSARVAQEARERTDELLAMQEIERKRLTLNQKRKALEAQMQALRVELAAEEHKLQMLGRQEQKRLQKAADDRTAMAKRRTLEMEPAGNGRGPRRRGGRR